MGFAKNSGCGGFNALVEIVPLPIAAHRPRMLFGFFVEAAQSFFLLGFCEVKPKLEKDGAIGG